MATRTIYICSRCSAESNLSMTEGIYTIDMYREEMHDSRPIKPIHRIIITKSRWDHLCKDCMESIVEAFNKLRDFVERKEI